MAAGRARDGCSLLLGVPDEMVRTDVATARGLGRPLVLGQRPGSPTCALRRWWAPGSRSWSAGASSSSGSSTPVPVLYRGFVLHPRDAEDPYAFQIDFSDFGLDTFPVVFSRDRGTTAVHFDAMPVSA